MNRSRALELRTRREDPFGAPVDLATEKAVHAEARPFIAKEAVHV